jgi:multiple sugar transport system permease protein
MATRHGRGRRWLAKESQRGALAGLWILPTFLATDLWIGPILAAIGISFTSYDMLTPAKFIGLANYTQLLSDPRLRTVYLNTFIFTIFAVTFNIGVGLLLAVMINRRMPALLRYLFRTAYFFPTLVALVYCGIIWQFLYQKDTGIITLPELSEC